MYKNYEQELEAGVVKQLAQDIGQQKTVKSVLKYVNRNLAGGHIDLENSEIQSSFR